MWASVLVLVAGLMGAAGLAMLAAAAHIGGGDLARTGGTILLVHAVAVMATAAPACNPGTASRGALAAATVLAVGTALFGTDLAFAAFLGAHPVPLAAPLGGMGMIAGWLLFAASGVARLARRNR